MLKAAVSDRQSLRAWENLTWFNGGQVLAIFKFALLMQI